MTNTTFVNNLKLIGVEIGDKQLEQFDKYYETLVEWNKFMNLTGITEYEEVQLKHFVDSLVLKTPFCGQVCERQISKKDEQACDVDRQVSDKDEQACVGDKNRLEDKNYILSDAEANIANLLNKDNLTLIDVGTGAGFPGIPLKIAYPNIKVTLLDSLNKRLNFLNEVIDRLQLQNIITVHSRAEDGGRDINLREQFDISVSRAVANLSTLVEYNLPFVRVGGYFVAYKSGDIDIEVEEARNAVKSLGGRIDLVYKFKLPNSDIDRSLVYIKKEKKTPSRYPRKAGLPSKEPIK